MGAIREWHLVKRDPDHRLWQQGFDRNRLLHFVQACDEYAARVAIADEYLRQWGRGASWFAKLWMDPKMVEARVIFESMAARYTTERFEAEKKTCENKTLRPLARVPGFGS